MKLEIGQIVYHKDVYNYKEPLTVRGVIGLKVLLEGDFSGGTHNIIQKDWLPIDGVSRIKNYSYLKECRRTAVDIEALSIPVDWDKNNMTKTCRILLDMVLTLTNEIDLHNKQI